MLNIEVLLTLGHIICEGAVGVVPGLQVWDVGLRAVLSVAVISLVLRLHQWGRSLRRVVLSTLRVIRLRDVTLLTELRLGIPSKQFG